jgi:F-type H+-transporting ATPase subunit gamma
MPSLKDLRVRIASVTATQKITSAMKMVAAAKLRRAQEQAEAARPYAERMERMLGSLAAASVGQAGAPALLAGSGKQDGGFNSNIVRDSRQLIESLLEDSKTVKIICVGRKGRDQLRRQYGDMIIDTIEDVTKPRPTFEKSEAIAERITRMFEGGEFDVCTLIYAEFKSAITQIVTRQQLIPFAPAAEDEEVAEAGGGQKASYEYEPSEEEILEALLPRNLAVQIYKGILENNASEQGSRMTAMDNATRNAGDMINDLTLIYNRTRQAVITRELIEIISAKEAL